MEITIRFASWWLACFLAAVSAKDWRWALWLADHPSVEIE